jgi:hypothetical protein
MLHAWSVSRRLKKIGKAAEPRAEFARALETRFGLEPARPTVRSWMFVASGAFAVLLLAVIITRPDQPTTPTQLLTAQPEQATEREAEKVAQVSDQPPSITETSTVTADQEELDAFFAEFLSSELTAEELGTLEADLVEDPSDVILEESLDTEAILS